MGSVNCVSFPPFSREISKNQKNLLQEIFEIDTTQCAVSKKLQIKHLFTYITVLEEGHRKAVCTQIQQGVNSTPDYFYWGDLNQYANNHCYAIFDTQYPRRIHSVSFIMSIVILLKLQGPKLPKSFWPLFQASKVGGSTLLLP